MNENLTREEAITLAGHQAVESVESKVCEPTNRVGVNGACQGDDLTEWSATVSLENGDTLTAYYYTDNDEDRLMGESDGDGSCIDWEIHHFAIR